jgi:hypothetical protein
MFIVTATFISSSPTRVKNEFHVVQTSSRVHPTACPMGTRGSFPRGKVAGAWSRPLTSSWCRGQENVDLYIHSPTHLHGAVLNQLSIGTTLPFFHWILALSDLVMLFQLQRLYSINHDGKMIVDVEWITGTKWWCIWLALNCRNWGKQHKSHKTKQQLRKDTNLASIKKILYRLLSHFHVMVMQMKT